MRSTHISTLNSKHRKVTKATVGNLTMRGQMGKDSPNRLRLDCTGCHSCCSDKKPSQLVVATLEMCKMEKRPKALQLALQCDFRGVVEKERLTGKAEEGSNLSQ